MATHFWGGGACMVLWEPLVVASRFARPPGKGGGRELRGSRRNSTFGATRTTCVRRTNSSPLCGLVCVSHCCQNMGPASASFELSFFFAYTSFHLKDTSDEYTTPPSSTVFTCMHTQLFNPPMSCVRSPQNTPRRHPNRGQPKTPTVAKT